MSEVQSIVEYRDIPGHPGYRAGSDGTIWALSESSWIPVIQGSSKGYCLVTIGKGVRAKVHRLILETFVGPCPPGMECCHSPDNNPSNNSVGNLRWDTHANNAKDRTLHGTFGGRKHPHAKLYDSDIPAIRYLLKHCFGTKKVAKIFGVSRMVIYAINKGRAWTHVK